MHTRTFSAMGTTAEIAIAPPSIEVESIETDLETVLDTTESIIREHEGRLSRFRSDSDVARVNARLGTWVPVHPATARVAALAVEGFEATAGLFNPCLGTWLESLGYAVSFDMLPSPSEDPVPTLPPASGAACPLEVRESERRVRVAPGYKLDLGGLAKGWIVEQAALYLRSHGVHDFIVSAGGDMVCSGRHGERPWQVGIADPQEPARTLLTLDVDNLSLATSGTYRRRWQRAGATLHHLIDPRTGRPAETDVVSCSVLHPRLAAAEVLAKAALLLGSTDGMPWLRRHAPDGWVIVTKHGRVIHAWNW
ncbi:FAD:protein FMN transferase [Alicyclobacillus shizuokensis]|uniref:FAD:protein FMN transferase n=1 Tax=Alicyclobacillus shizuokensis TaxID=392014 RepID=UPI0009F8B04D|nr:FAD:protein FMN transferase [Alicyclobacillus shizuokensis]